MKRYHCPDCGHKVKADMESCPECGRKIAGHTRVCPSCGELVSAKRKVCHVCHARMDEEAERQDDDEKNSGGGSFWRTLLFTFVALLLLTGTVAAVLWWRNEQAQARERAAYHLLEGCMQAEVYRDFIEHYPDSPLLDDVVHRMHEVERLSEEWDIVCRKDTRQAYTDFADKHVNTPYYKLCMACIDSVDWATAHRRETIEAYTQYLKKHPEGIYAEDARERRKTLEELRVTPEEQAMLRGLFNTYFAALTHRNEQSLRQVLAFLTVRYWGHDNASQDYAVERMKRMYDGSDIRSISFMMRDNWQVRKEIVRPYRYAYHVNFKADAFYNRTRPGGGRSAVFRVAARVSVDHKIDSLELHKETPGAK